MAKEIKIATVGIGNCFSGLVQGIQYYIKHPEKKKIGLMHEKIGGYSIEDLNFVAAFDIGKHKVGKPLKEAIYAKPNEVKWVENINDIKGKNTIVKESPILDGVGKYVKDMFDPIQQTKSVEELKSEIIDEIKKSGAKIIMNYLPVGSEKAVKFWAEIALETNCAFVNNMPVFIASNEEWAKRFKEKNLPIIGDDIKSQFGATIVHRVLTWLCKERGVKIDNTYQLNVGGNTDFANMIERSRLKSKKISKTESVQSQMSEKLPDENIYIGPSDFVPFLKNKKLAFMRIEGRMFADVPFNLELRLEVNDKANSGGTSIEAIRLAQVALDRGIGGPIYSAASYLMKHPPKQVSDAEAKQAVEDFIEGKRND